MRKIKEALLSALISASLLPTVCAESGFYTTCEVIAGIDQGLMHANGLVLLPKKHQQKYDSKLVGIPVKEVKAVVLPMIQQDLEKFEHGNGELNLPRAEPKPANPAVLRDLHQMTRGLFDKSVRDEKNQFLDKQPGMRLSYFQNREYHGLILIEQATDKHNPLQSTLAWRIVSSKDAPGFQQRLAFTHMKDVMSLEGLTMGRESHWIKNFPGPYRVPWVTPVGRGKASQAPPNALHMVELTCRELFNNVSGKMKALYPTGQLNRVSNLILKMMVGNA